MTTDITFSLIRIACLTWLLFWIWSARGVKRTERSESFWSGLSHRLALMCGMVLIYIGPGPRWIPRSEAVNLFAVALTWGGVLFSIWARAILGRNWSSSVTLKQEHELISTGPYSKVRNPIYTGMLLGGFGVVVAIGTAGAVAGYLIAFAALVRKSLIEERMLTTHFGEAYIAYRRRTKLLIPYVF
jgi:protein-S-isoprenylcysteine O-methyltransferase Ste14